MTQFWVRSIMTHLVRVADVPLSTHSSTIFRDKLPTSHGHCHCTMGLGNYIISGRAPDGSRQGRFDLRVSKQPAFRYILLTTFSQFMDQIYCRCLYPGPSSSLCYSFLSIASLPLRSASPPNTSILYLDYGRMPSSISCSSSYQ